MTNEKYRRSYSWDKGNINGINEVTNHMTMQSFIKKIRPTGLSKKLITLVVLVSSITSLMVTVTNIFLDYRNESNRIDETIGLIKENNAQALTFAVWNFEDNLIGAQLDGILHFRYLATAKVLDSKGVQVLSRGRGELLMSRNYQIPLIFKRDNGEVVNLGILDLAFDLQQLYMDLVNKFAIVFFSQFIKMLIASMVLVYFFRKLLVFPLVDVQNQLLSMNFEKDELRIPHRWSMGKEDELDGMFKSVQMMIAKVRGSQNELKKLNSELDNLAHQRAEIIVSQRKMIEESERFASLGKMAGGIAHEINTPLAAALMRIEHLRRHNYIQSQTEVLGSLEKVDKVLVKISDIVSSMRSLYRDGSNEELQPVDIEKALQDTLTVCREKLALADVKSRMVISTKGLHVLGTPTQISQVILNLVNNAFDAIESLPEKWIELKVEDGVEYVDLLIVDSGAGIPADVVQKMFDPYYTTKGVGKGSGLGLSLVRTILQRISAEIKYCDEAKNTTFHVRFQKITDPNAKTKLVVA